MKVYKDLMGDGSKIHSDEIVVGTKSKHQTLTEELDDRALRIYRYISANTTVEYTMNGREFFFVCVSAPSLNHNTIGLYLVNHITSTYSYVYPIKESSYCEIEADRSILSVTANTSMNIHIIRLTES